ncbi:MAG: MFS transporter [Clostridia bacterium]|nr:MFS transporter [Clostridia bacterium]
MTKLKEMKMWGKNLDPHSPLENQRNVTLLEYISICIARIGGMLVTTVTGTLAVAYGHELYYGSIGMDADRIADVNAVQTTLTQIVGILATLLSAVIVQRWHTKWGRYRQWYLICLIPVFIQTVLYFYIPQGWSENAMIWFKYSLAVFTTAVTTFNNLGQQIPQVISPNQKEKKSIATLWQLSYYIGYGGAYIYIFVYGEISKNKYAMYVSAAVVGAVISVVGNVMCALFCRERIELPKKEKVKISGALFKLFKYRNYRAYYYMQWANCLAMLGKMTTYLVAITVGSSKNILLTIPSAAGTVIGNVITAKVSKKYEPTKLLRFCGIYSMACAIIIFATCGIQSAKGIYFFEGWNSIFFYLFYFLFGVGIGVQELSTSHFTVEFNDYLEWETGQRLEAIHGVVPGWLTAFLNYIKELLIPYMLAWTGYKSSQTGDLVETMQAEPGYLKTCMWLLAFLVFGYAIANLIKAIVLKFLYDVEGEKKVQMYEDLSKMRIERHSENEETAQ